MFVLEVLALEVRCNFQVDQNEYVVRDEVVVVCLAEDVRQLEHTQDLVLGLLLARGNIEG